MTTPFPKKEIITNYQKAHALQDVAGVCVDQTHLD